MRGRDPEKPRVCVLTAPTRGAIGVVRVWGNGAVGLADRVFRPASGAPLASSGTDRPRFGKLGEGHGDEVVAIIVGPAGRGCEPEVEIHCHGGPEPVNLVVRTLVAGGGRPTRAEAWVRHASPSRSIALARYLLSRAPTLRVAEILLEQASGALARDVELILVSLASDPPAAQRGIDTLLDRASIGLRLTLGWSVALAGRPNVGKSRLLNTLAGYERAIVDPTPGTTRDIVTVRTSFDGWPVELADTAGLRVAADPLESAGIALARGRHASADLTLLVLDRSMPLNEDDHTLLAGLPNALAVANKCDLPAAWIPEEVSRRNIFTVSAETREGLDELVAGIARRLVPAPPGPGTGVPFRRTYTRWLSNASHRLREGDIDSAAQALRDMLR